jgi:hypothetical protein
MSIEGGPQNVSLYNDTTRGLKGLVNYTLHRNLSFFGKLYTFYYNPFNAIGRNPRRSEYY